MQVVDTGRLGDGSYYLTITDKRTGVIQYANAYYSATSRDTAIFNYMYGRLPGTGYTTRINEDVAGLTSSVYNG